jgi:hypothetical protein
MLSNLAAVVLEDGRRDATMMQVVSAADVACGYRGSATIAQQLCFPGDAQDKAHDTIQLSR